MTVERSIRLLAGTLVMGSLILNYYFPNGYWIYLTAFVGFNLFQSALTNFCPAEIIIKKLFFSK